MQHYGSKHCIQPNVVDCIVFPSNRLHRSKTEVSLDYFAELIVTNKAGHMTTKRTHPFQIQSKIAPSRGVVIDVNENSDEFTDLDFVLYPSKLCVQWKGFEHHKNITFEVGVGTKEGISDAIRFNPVTDLHRICFNGTELKPFVKYYSNVKARCTGGETIVSSDGFTIIDEKLFLSNFKVQDGKGCPSQKPIPIYYYLGRNKTNYEVQITDTVEIGKIYSLVVYSKFVTINSPNAMLLTTNTGDTFTTYTFVAKSQLLHFATNTDKAFNASFYQCNIDEQVLQQTDEISVHWTLQQDNLTKPTRFQVQVRNELNSNVMTMQATPGSATFASFQNVHLVDNMTYHFEVYPCYGQFCLNYTTSNGFVCEKDTLLIYLEEANLVFSGTRATLNVIWKAMSRDSGHGHIFGFWALCMDESGRDIFFNWTEIRNTNKVRIMQIVLYCLSIFGCHTFQISEIGFIISKTFE